MRRPDYIPQSGGKFLEWVRNLLLYIRAHAAEWGLDPSTVAEIERLLSIYEAAYEKAETPNRGSADVLAKNESHNALKKAARQYVKEYLINNHLVTDEDRKLMGLPIHDTKPTPAPVSTTPPKADVKQPSPAVVEVHFYDVESENRGKPPGQSGVEFAWVIADGKPADWDDLIHSSFCTRSPLRLSFKATDRGKTLYFALRWQNTRGLKGPWSEIESTIIP
ncbi:MAG: hypothetical protein LBE13_21210 [Bacteroidales bacterium]|jgi:hypothetical protein|nr:hypothetical protein [Bacteroidales bacterium]